MNTADLIFFYTLTLSLAKKIVIFRFLLLTCLNICQDKLTINPFVHHMRSVFACQQKRVSSGRVRRMINSIHLMGGRQICNNNNNNGLGIQKVRICLVFQRSGKKHNFFLNVTDNHQKSEISHVGQHVIFKIFARDAHLPSESSSGKFLHKRFTPIRKTKAVLLAESNCMV